MHILFLSHYFPPEVNAPATRTFEHCRRWVEMGHQVTVISCVPHHPMGKAYPGYRNKLVHVEYKEGIRAIKVLTYITANEGFLKRTFNYVFYMVMATLIAPFLSRPDVVISTSPQFFNGLAGYLVSRLLRRPWLLEIRDLWPESIVAVGAIRNRRIIGALEWLERFIYRKADHIVAVTQAFKRHIVANGGAEDRVSVIRNGVDLNFFDDSRAQDCDFARELGVENQFVAAYVGTHGMAHGLDTLLDAARLLRHRDDIVLLTAGDGAERERLQQRVVAEGLDNVKMLGQLPKADMPRLWSITGASLVLLKRLDLFLTVIPSKIFESMAMRRPIVLAVKGESQEIIAAADCGICIEPENAQALAQAIEQLADDPQRCVQLGANGHHCVEAEFDRIKLAERFEALLQKLVARS